MKFKPYDPTKPHRPRSQAQIEQVRVVQIRGLYYHASALSGWRAQVMRLLCDAELLARGQETQTARHQRQMREWEAEADKREAARDDEFSDIPF